MRFAGSLAKLQTVEPVQGNSPLAGTHYERATTTGDGSGFKHDEEKKNKKETVRRGEDGHHRVLEHFEGEFGT